MTKKLRKWNGGGWRNGVNKCGSVYVGAYSITDAIRLLKAAGHPSISYREIKDYFSECWGNAMNDIELKRGVWIEKEKFSGNVIRII